MQGFKMAIKYETCKKKKKKTHRGKLYVVFRVRATIRLCSLKTNPKGLKTFAFTEID